MSVFRLCLIIVVFLSTRPAAAQELKVFFGLLHGHTSFSDGSGEPDEAFEMAKEAGLDFFAVTEHNHAQAAGKDKIFLTPPLYGKLIQSARANTKADKFLAIWGQEVSTISAGNHANIFFADQICDMPNGDFKFLYETFLPKHGEVPFMQFNHPAAQKDQSASTKAKERNNDYGIDDYDKDFDQLVAAAGKHVALIELIIGPAFSKSNDKLHQDGKHEKDYLFYLNKGFRLAPSVGQDNHNKTWGTATHARMGIWATRLTPEGFIEAVRERRTFASEDENAEVRFTVNDKIMGSVIPASETATIKVSVKDEDEPNAKYRVRLFYDDAVGGEIAKAIENQPLDEGESEIEFVHTPDPGGYYFVKITQQGDNDNDDMWTAPVWIGDPQRLLIASRSTENTDDPQKDEIPWDEASDYVGEDVVVSGKVIRSFNFQDKAVFFNFDEDYQNTLTIVVLKSDFDAFGGKAGVSKLQKRLANKVVRVKGTVSLYANERIQLRLTSPEQLLDVTDEEEPSDDE